MNNRMFDGWLIPKYNEMFDTEVQRSTELINKMNMEEKGEEEEDGFNMLAVLMNINRTLRQKRKGMIWVDGEGQICFKNLHLLSGDRK